MQTYGEQLVQQRLSELPRQEYFFVAEPLLKATKGHEAYTHPDFVVVSARLGVIVLEVKDWVKITQATQREVTIERRDGQIVVERNPVTTAREYAFNLESRFKESNELLSVYQGKVKLKFPWMYAAILPNISREVIDQITEKGIWQEGTVLGREDLAPQCLHQAFKNLPSPWRMDGFLSAGTLDVIRGVLDPTIIVNAPGSGQPAGVLTRKQEEEVKRPLVIAEPNAPRQMPLLDADLLSAESEQVAHAENVRLVRGVAGSGKSLVLARRAQHLAEHHPNLKILVLAFNVDLVDDLQRRMRNMPNIEVINFHKVCAAVMGNRWLSPLNLTDWIGSRFADLLGQHRLTPEFVSEEIEWRKEMKLNDAEDYYAAPREGRQQSLTRAKREVIEHIFLAYHQHCAQHGTFAWCDVPLHTLPFLQPGNPRYKAYDAILIDEAQDFAPSWIEIIKKLLKSGGHLFMCDDPTQSLFRAYSWRQKGIEVVGKTRILRVPFRSTREIIEAAYGLINADSLLSKADDVTQPDLTAYELVSGEKPLLIEFRSEKGEDAEVDALLRKQSENGIPPEQIAILCHHRNMVKRWASLRSKGLYVESFEKMKGLEFHTVIVPGVHTALPEAVADEYASADKKKRLFTAMTRARRILVLTCEASAGPRLRSLLNDVQIVQR